MAARTTWRGAIELAGFPVNVALYNRVKSAKNVSFTSLGSDNQPIHQVIVEHGEFEKLVEDPHAKVRTIGRNDVQKGIEVADGYKVIDADSLAKIAERQKSASVEPRSFVPLDTIDLALADRSFTVVPDEKVPGSEKSVEILAAGLLATGLAYTTEITTRAGSRDAILVLYVAETDRVNEPILLGASIPFVHELQDVPHWEAAPNAKAAKMFKAVVAELEEPAFDHAGYESTNAAVRQAAIDATLKGETIKVPKAKAPKGTDDLLAAMEAAVSTAAPKKRKPAAKRAKAKVSS